MTTVKYEPQAGDELECEGGPLCCWQAWNGTDSLEEGGGRHALTVLSKRKPVPPPMCSGCGAEVHSRACTACSAPLVARALFRTDPRAIAFVESVSDHLCWPSYEGADINYERLEDAWAKAWERNEGGLRTEAQSRARAMLDVIRESAPSEGSDP